MRRPTRTPALLALCVIGLAAAPSQASQLLYAFSNQPGNTGYGSKSALITDATGALFGTTNSGGPNGPYGDGVAYELTPPPAGQTAWTQTVLHDFGNGRHDGTSPLGLVSAPAGGVLYGATELGGANGLGTIYALVPPSGTGAGWSEHILYSFQTADGIYPNTGLVIDAAGNLYGTLNQGGIVGPVCGVGCAVVFRLAPPQAGQSAWTETTVYQFTGGADGDYVDSKLVIDPKGNLYGEAHDGTTRHGLVYRLTPPVSGQGSWTQTILHDFAGPPTDGIQGSGLLIDPTGTLYGSTVEGGDKAGPPTTCFMGCGIAFRLAPPSQPGASWTETVLYDFSASARGGYIPAVSAITATGAVLGLSYGGVACPAGGTVGLAFQLSPPASGQGAWTEQPIFGTSCAYGDGLGPLLVGRNGSVTGSAGFQGPLGGGSVFRFFVH